MPSISRSIDIMKGPNAFLKETSLSFISIKRFLNLRYDSACILKLKSRFVYQYLSETKNVKFPNKYQDIYCNISGHAFFLIVQNEFIY